jgi:hypothetical protein
VTSAIATTRSNYFRVKHRTLFEAWCSSLGLEVWTKDAPPMGLCRAISGPDCGRWPDEDPDGEPGFDFHAELAQHIHPPDVAVLLDHITGHAAAIASDGRVVEVRLDDIYQRAADAFGAGVTITKEAA